MADVGLAQLGSLSSHGGVITSVSSTILCEGKLVACVGDVHTCPIKGHGSTPIVDGNPGVIVNGKILARIGSTTGCGATITTGSVSVTTNG